MDAHEHDRSAPVRGEGVERDPLDRYYTPQWAADVAVSRTLALIREWGHGPVRAIEIPSVGGGAFLRAVLDQADHAEDVSAFDLDPNTIGSTWPIVQDAGRRCRVHIGDYLVRPPPRVAPDLVIDNPPNIHAHQFVRRSVYARFRAFLLRLAFVETQTCKQEPPRYVGVLPRITFEGPAMVGRRPLPFPQPYALFVWDASRPSGPIALEHLGRATP